MEFFSSFWQSIGRHLILLAIANGAPVFFRNVFGPRFAWPIDLGHSFIDKRPLLGHSKTWRGLFSSILLTSLLAPSLGLPISLGALFGILAMSGDLLSSFIKRRLGYEASSRFRLLDTIPESLFPMFFLREQLGVTITEIILIVILFFTLEVILSPLLYRLHIRNRPY
ncbi:CDP-archaeol synthase [Methylomarinum vadi]|uniref:CDP-archaeol synthase n=1 Tax=Methylomarinum vadi TaxID=438855 RepID=UPI0004DFAE96|nr:CDP-archaeol synthase [Methylomarinum vadi]